MKLMEKTVSTSLAAALPSVAAPAMPIAASGASQAARLVSGEGGWQLEHDPKSVVRVAVSCLIAPMAGDLVLVSAVNGTWYVLAVLERDAAQGNTLCVDLGSAQLHLKAADVRFEVEGKLDLQAENLRLHSELAVQSASTQVVNVSGVSMLNANSIAMEGRQSLSMHTQLGAIQATALLKIDGTQMHFG